MSSTQNSRLRILIERSGLTLQIFAESVGLTMGQLNGILYNNVKLRSYQAANIATTIAKDWHDMDYEWLWYGPEEERTKESKTPDWTERLDMVAELAAIGKDRKCAKIECDGIIIEFHVEPTKFEVSPKETKEFDEEILFRSAG